MTKVEQHTVADALQRGIGALSSSPTPRLDAELLLGHSLGRERAFLYAHPEHRLTDSEQAAFARLIECRGQGEPLAYLLGRREFWSLDLEVSQAALIPRPETELLVEAALQRLPADAPWRVLDLGTGSGAIAIAIAHERPHARVVATDLDPATLAVASRNLGRVSLTNLTLRHGDWYRPLRGERFDLIVSNPPYIAEDDPHLDQGDVRWEPRRALVSGSDGLDAIRTLVAGAPAHLEPGGWLLLEHGWDQQARVSELLHQAGFEERVTYRDLGGNPRVAGGRLRARG